MTESGKTRILIAEDEQDIRELIKLTLEFSEYEVATAQDGPEAIQLAQKGDFDVILLDVRMPRMNGYEVCRQLRQISVTHYTPVIFLSAKGQEEEVQAGLDAGADDYILKPFSPSELSRKIEDVLGS